MARFCLMKNQQSQAQPGLQSLPGSGEKGAAAVPLAVARGPRIGDRRPLGPLHALARTHTHVHIRVTA